MNFLISILANLIGRKPTTTDLIVASLNATVNQLQAHSEKSQSKADAHIEEMQALAAKHAALVEEATKAAQVAINIGSLLK